MEDRNEETWWLFYLHVRKKYNNLYYITINKWQQLLDPKKKFTIFSLPTASRFATEVFFVIWEVLISSLFSSSVFSNTFEGDNSTIFFKQFTILPCIF